MFVNNIKDIKIRLIEVKDSKLYEYLSSKHIQPFHVVYDEDIKEYFYLYFDCKIFQNEKEKFDKLNKNFKEVVIIEA
jgi:hypothetical protein